MENKPEPSIEYEDTDTWKSGSELSIKEISLNLFNKAMREGSKEMTKGGIMQRYINGELVELVLPNQREIFINSVQMAYVPLLPHILKCDNVEVKEMFKRVDEEIDRNDEMHYQALATLQSQYTDLNFKRPTPNSREFLTVQNRIHDYNNKLAELDELNESRKVQLGFKLLKAISYLLYESNYFDEAGVVLG